MTDENQTRWHSSADPDATVMARHRTPYQPPKKKGFKKALLLLLIPVILLLLAGMGVVAFFVGKHFLFDNNPERPDTELVQRELSIDEALFKLSGLNLSLSDIQNIESSVVHTGVRADEERLNRRLIALKHLYTNEFLREDHTAKNMRGIYMLYSTDFSHEQQNALKWFMNLPSYQQDQWEYVRGNVDNFNDFRQKMEAELQGR